MSNSLAASISPLTPTAGAASSALTFAPKQVSALDTTTPTIGSGSASSAGNSSLSVNNLGTTFLSLLSQELQNQDPTQPMDPTAMVGQMISLNQLDQLIQINQTLDPTSTSTTGTGTGSGAGTGTGTGASGDAVSGIAGQTSMAQLASAAASAAGAQADQGNALASTVAQHYAALGNTTPLNLNAISSRIGGK